MNEPKESILEFLKAHDIKHEPSADPDFSLDEFVRSVQRGESLLCMVGGAPTITRLGVAVRIMFGSKVLVKKRFVANSGKVTHVNSLHLTAPLMRGENPTAGILRCIVSNLNWPAENLDHRVLDITLHDKKVTESPVIALPGLAMITMVYIATWNMPAIFRNPNGYVMSDDLGETHFQWEDTEEAPKP